MGRSDREVSGVKGVRFRPIADSRLVPQSDHMRVLPLILGLLCSCGQRPQAPPDSQGGTVEWKAAYTAAECKALTDVDAIVKRCFGGHLSDENYIGDFQCLPYSPPQRFRGVWVLGLEYSGFFLNASSYNEGKGQPDKIWLRADPLPSSEIRDALQGAGTRAYAVDLIGRRTLCDQNYGHFGMWPQEIIATQITALERLPVSN